MPPSKLAIATSSLTRLIKEEASYHKELTQQQARLNKLEVDPEDDGNKNFRIKQEKIGIEETKKMFPKLEGDIAAAKLRLQEVLKEGVGSETEIAKAKEVLGPDEA